MDKTSEKLALSREYTKTIGAVKKSLQTKFGIADNVPFAQYPEKIYPAAQNALKFSKSAGYTYDPYIPPYRNIEISGMTTPAANGTWANQRPDYSGTACLWKNGNYQLVFDSDNSYWCLMDAGASTINYYNAYFYAKVFSTNDSGTQQNPWIWDNHSSADRKTADTVPISDTNMMGYGGVFYCFNLKKGVTYKIGVHTNATDTSSLYWYTYLYSSTSSMDYGSELASGSDPAEINGVLCYHTMTYTPTADGTFIYKVATEYYSSTDGIYVQPMMSVAPEAYVAPSTDPWDFTFKVNKGSGTLVMSAIEVPEKASANSWRGYEAFPIVENGVTHYEFADVLTENLPWSDMAPQEGEIFSGDGAIKAAYVKGNQQYADNETAWKINVTSANFVYRMGIAGGAGNIIDWGDGSTTTTVGANDFSENTSTFTDTNGRYSHTYASAGSYMIRVVGDTVQHICTQLDTSWSFNNSFSHITEVYSASKTLTSCSGMFYGQGALKKVHDTFQIPQGCTSCYRMFYNTAALEYMPVSLRLPNTCRSFNWFMDVSPATDKLKTDISHWFDNFVFGSHWGANAEGWSLAFKGRTGLTGTVPAEKLWLDGSWGASYGDKDTFQGLTGLNNYSDIPETWK